MLDLIPIDIPRYQNENRLVAIITKNLTAVIDIGIMFVGRTISNPPQSNYNSKTIHNIQISLCTALVLY